MLPKYSTVPVDKVVGKKPESTTSHCFLRQANALPKIYAYLLSYCFNYLKQNQAFKKNIFFRYFILFTQQLFFCRRVWTSALI